MEIYVFSWLKIIVDFTFLICQVCHGESFPKRRFNDLKHSRFDVFWPQDFTLKQTLLQQVYIVLVYIKHV